MAVAPIPTALKIAVDVNLPDYEPVTMVVLVLIEQMTADNWSRLLPPMHRNTTLTHREVVILYACDICGTASSADNPIYTNCQHGGADICTNCVRRAVASPSFTPIKGMRPGPVYSLQALVGLVGAGAPPGVTAQTPEQIDFQRRCDQAEELIDALRNAGHKCLTWYDTAPRRVMWCEHMEMCHKCECGSRAQHCLQFVERLKAAGHHCAAIHTNADATPESIGSVYVTWCEQLEHKCKD